MKQLTKDCFPKHTSNSYNSIKKWGKDLSPKKTYRWLINTWKDAQHCSLLEKCRSKLQWDITSHQSEWLSSKSTNNKCWRACGEEGTLLNCWWECKLIQPLWKTVWRFLKKLGIKPPGDPAIPLLDIHAEKTKIEKYARTPLWSLQRNRGKQ